MLQVILLLLTSAALMTAGPASATSISWNPAADTTGPADVSTSGVLLKAFDSGGSGATVNGVTFNAAGGPTDDVYAGISLGTFGAFDDDADIGPLDLLLRTANYESWPLGTPPAVITLTGLTPGSEYLLQLFFMDQRGRTNSPPAGCVGCNDRQVTFISGANSVTLDADPGNTVGAPFGQYAIGFFVADATTQGFQVTGIAPDISTSHWQVNAWQVRAIPEPATSAMISIGILLLAARFRSTSRDQMLPR